MDEHAHESARLTGRLTARRWEIGTRWKAPDVDRKALLTLAHLRCGDTYPQLSAGSDVGIATVYRYVQESVDLLAALTPTLDEAMTTARTKALAILDGTLLPIDRIAADTPYYSGKHQHHGIVLADPFGQLLWASAALPGSTHDLTAACTHKTIDALARRRTQLLGDLAYQGAGHSVRVPFRGRRPPGHQGPRRQHNTTHMWTPGVFLLTWDRCFARCTRQLTAARAEWAARTATTTNTEAA
ncbi:transposase family protein [Streptomyces sp. NPDC057623]|uniref:transposase family protein n=1 Tax=Streptomyces sp. NPDC057623 TaxID=3346187 RepID=UPI0036B2C695